MTTNDLTLTYREIHDPAELDSIVDLQTEVWSMGPRSSTPHNMLLAISHSGGMVIGAEDGDRIVGFVLAFIARFDDEYGLWSHMAGVHPDYQRHGIGLRLKFEQRLWALRNGYSVIKWTYDPLQRGNAKFNLRQLGAFSNRYHVNFYGVMNDGINAGMQSDRLEITWELNDPRVVMAASGEALPAEVDAYPDEYFLLRAVPDEGPQMAAVPDVEKPCYFIEVPYNILALKKHDLTQAQRWQFAIREVLGGCLSRGYRVVDFVIDGERCWYVLKK